MNLSEHREDRDWAKPPPRCLALNAPRCPKCPGAMRVCLLIPGELEERVTYRCERCRAEVICTVALDRKGQRHCDRVVEI
jgi:hypothetical protein